MTATVLRVHCVIPEAHHARRDHPRGPAQDRGVLACVCLPASLHDCANARLIGRTTTSMMPTRSTGGSLPAASNRRHHARTRQQSSSSPPSPEQQQHPWRATTLANTAAAESGSSSRRESVELLGQLLVPIVGHPSHHHPSSKPPLRPAFPSLFLKPPVHPALPSDLDDLISLSDQESLPSLCTLHSHARASLAVYLLLRPFALLRCCSIPRGHELRDYC